uniref:RBP-Jkappa IPT domain-containing protein n=1 Tax=Sus scrofa TaxID=9823 RepID=A0A8D1EJI4_PIG
GFVQAPRAGKPQGLSFHPIPQASPCPKEANKALLNDSSCWTIIGTESVEFSFSTSLACTREPVTPVPLISTLELSGGGDVATLELHGENFHAGLKVWFGDVEAETMFRYGEGLPWVLGNGVATGAGCAHPSQCP